MNETVKSLRNIARYIHDDGDINSATLEGIAERVEQEFAMIPKDKDGDVIEIGKTLYGGDGQAWHIIGFKPGMKYDVIGQKPTGEVNSHLRGKWLSKTDPNNVCVGTDKLPIEPGDKVWIDPKYRDELTYGGISILGFQPDEPMTVAGIDTTYNYEVEVRSHSGVYRRVAAAWLTHKQPVISANGVQLEEGMTVWVTMEHAKDCNRDCGELGNKAGLWGYKYGTPACIERIGNAASVSLGLRYGPWCPASWLTTEEPDTQERIDRDKMKDVYEYWDCAGTPCWNCHAMEDGKNPRQRYAARACGVAQGINIARRQAALDAALEGEVR